MKNLQKFRINKNLVIIISVFSFLAVLCLPKILFKYTIIKRVNSYVEDTTPPPINTLIFGGDVMLSRYVDIQMIKNNNYKGPLEGISEYMSSADITFVNLESPFSPTPLHQPLGMVFGADIKSLEGIKHAGIDIVSLANNHFGDSKREGMDYTMDQLKNNHIYYTGAGKNTLEANTPTYIESKGIIFAFLGYSDISPYYAALENTSGYALIPDNETLKTQIEKAKLSADIVIISIHTGIEYAKYPQQRLKDFAHTAIDCGASLVIGHHPHVIQPVEQYKDGLIFYSLGNLVFDQYFDGTKEGILSEIVFENKSIKGYKITPIIIEDLWKARLANSEESKKILERTK